MSYFQLEDDNFSNKIDKNKFENFEIIASQKKPIESWRTDCKRCSLARTTFHNFMLGLEITKLKTFIFQPQVLFVWERYKSLYIYINATYVNENHHCRLWHNAGPQDSPLLSTNLGVSPLYGLVVSSFICHQIFIKTSKFQINETK